MDENNIQQQIDDLRERVIKLEKTLSISEQKTLPVQSPIKKQSLKEFLLEKNPSDDVKRTLAIAYFYEKSDGYTSVNTTDLLGAYEKAKEKKPKNINDKVNMNIKNGHMAESSEKKDSKKAWYVTNSGEKFVEYNFTADK